MTESEFESAIAGTRLQPRAAALARAVLVDGLTQSEAARAAGVTRQTANAAVERVLRGHRAVVGCPPGWEVVTVCVPPALAVRIRALATSEENS